MGSLAFLIIELQSLVSETKRKHPDVREAADRSLSILKASPEQAIAALSSDGPQSEELLRPVFMGCNTKNAKVVAISLGSLQRLIALKSFPQSRVPLVVSIMGDTLSQGVDIQLRILQTLLSLITNFPSVHGDLLAESLLLCFKLHESKIAVVSSTAAATLRQLVMFVVDKMVEEDKHEPDSELMTDVKLPDGRTLAMGPSTRDAFAVFEDLCLLTNGDRPNFLKLDYLHKTFALELIESVLTNYHDAFRKHPELLLLLQHLLCPLLLKATSDRPMFALTLRCTRVVFLLLKQFSTELPTESEVFLMHFIRIVADDGEGAGTGEYGATRPGWMRVMALEVIRGLCSDGELIRNFWARYDAKSSSSRVVNSLITSLKRIVTEKPALLGVGSQMSGVGVPSEAQSSGYGLDGMAEIVATAASATVSGVASIMGSNAGLNHQTCSMKIQCIDQLDKADAPPIPEGYLYLLGVQCIVYICDGFASYAAPLYTALVISKAGVSENDPVPAPPAFDLGSLPLDEKSTKHLRIVRDIIEAGWPALLAGLSFLINSNLSDEIFVDVLASYQAMTNVSGMLDLATPRDAFFTSLSRFAVPTRVVSGLASFTELQTPRSPTASISENLGFGSSQPPGLSERNLACLKVLISSAVFLAGSLGESWFGVLEVLQNADYVLNAKATQFVSGRRSMFSPSASLPASRSTSLSGVAMSQSVSGSGSSQGNPRHPLLTDLDSDMMLQSIQHLFDASVILEDSAYTYFVEALCRLSLEMVGMQSETPGVLLESESVEDITGPEVLSPKSFHSHKRRVSGIHIPRTMRAGDFGIAKLGIVTLLNIQRLVQRAPEVAWNATTSHLLSIIDTPFAPQSIRIQAAQVLDDILVVVPRNLGDPTGTKIDVQKRLLSVLSAQVLPHYGRPGSNSSTSVELRRMGLDTLHQILEGFGHTILVGWEVIFEMLGSVCSSPPMARSMSQDSISALSPSNSPPTRSKPLPIGLGAPTEKSYTGLIKIAFQSLKLVCDSVSLLAPEHLRLCITTLGQFGRQADTNIALTAAASLLWSVSDAIQSKRKVAEQEQEYSEIWMFLLSEVLGLCTDSRPEVRDGAIQTLFRALQLYGATLSLETWDQCVWRVIFPLFVNLTEELHRQMALPPGDDLSSDQAWNESKILALHSLGSLFHESLSSKIILLESFPDVWDTFVKSIEEAVLVDHRPISAPALRCLDKALKALKTHASRVPISPTVWRQAWHAIDKIGEGIAQRPNPSSPVEALRPYTQDSLLAFVDVIQSTRSLSRTNSDDEWTLEQLTRLMTILKGVLCYSSSPDYRPDVDTLPPVQTIVMEAIGGIELTASGVPSLVMRDLAEFATLPFLAAFDVPPDPRSQTPPRRVTYIALAKKIMPLLVEHVHRFKERLEIFVDGTFEAVLAAYSIPVKLKYDCPPASKFGDDPPLWKTATSNFLKIVKEWSAQITVFGQGIPAERLEGIWRQVIDVIRGGILADCSPAETLALDVQQEEEHFDLALITSLEVDVVAHLGDPRVPDALLVQLANVLQQGSQLFEHAQYDHTSSSQHGGLLNGNGYAYGSTSQASLLPRERFSYWCLDLLFLVCSDSEKDQERNRRRLSALALPALIARCRRTMVSYVADESLRGNLPFPRAREEELLYVLRKLHSLRLWPGSLWAALSSEPSEHCITLPPVDVSATPSEIVADTIRRLPVAHLFYFHSVLCDIVSIPRRTPSSWVRAENLGSLPIGATVAWASEEKGKEIVELDSRILARNCLKVMGHNMGIS